jgi:hypothetical protein
MRRENVIGPPPGCGLGIDAVCNKELFDSGQSGLRRI